MSLGHRGRARLLAGLGGVLGSAIAAACGDPPAKPGLVDRQPPAVNTPPVVEAIAIQGSRLREPGNFADLDEAIDVAATVRDDETAASQLLYVWSAPVGTFTGTGARVTWQAPARVDRTPLEVAIHLDVVERYSGAQPGEHRVSTTASLSLHDSTREVGDMARQFLLDFSDSNIRDVSYIMRNFGSSCPNQSEVDSERADVEANRQQYRIVSSRIGTAAVTVNFGATCPFRSRVGDACALIPAYWEAVDLRTNQRGAVDGTDIVAASYSSRDRRWWLCASDYDGRTVSGTILRGLIR